MSNLVEVPVTIFMNPNSKFTEREYFIDVYYFCASRRAESGRGRCVCVGGKWKGSMAEMGCCRVYDIHFTCVGGRCELNFGGCQC